MSYKNCEIHLTTKHQKQEAIAPAFKRILSANIVPCELDTDTLGTFSGEIHRGGSALECARRKCEWGMVQFNAFYGLASEGSFGPHPFIPLLACDHEILYFIDRLNGFHLHESLLSNNSNYQMQAFSSLEELVSFARKAQFPSHALIVRPNLWSDKSIIFKGITSSEALEEAFHICKNSSDDAQVWVETDMRAHMNPSRMKVIAELAENLARKLKAHCPNCSIPGWGKVAVQAGLECEVCNNKTDLVKGEILGCVKCSYQETKSRSDGLTKAPAGSCNHCNP